MFQTTLARKTWESKYQYATETPLQTQIRIARALADVEPKDKEYWFREFLTTLVRFEPSRAKHNTDDDYLEGYGWAYGLKATGGGRITANAGTPFDNTSVMNCYITGPVTGAEIRYQRKSEDGQHIIDVVIQTPNTGDNLANIYLTLMEQSQTLKSEGGWGMNFDWIRPRATLIKGIGIRHPGVVAFMELFDKSAEIIVRGNSDGYTDELNYLHRSDELVQTSHEKKMARKGAQMGVLSCWHPDIEEFIKAKQTFGKLTKFNISVLVTDELMEKSQTDADYDLVFDGKVYKTVKARDLYDLIMKSTYNRNEPGVLFYDNMQKNNPIAYLGDLNATNPCIRRGFLVPTISGIKRIEDVVVGDMIQTTLGFAPVKTIEVHENAEIFRVDFSDGSFIDATAAHIFHTQSTGVESRKKWNNEIRLADLKVGDKVRKQPYKFSLPEGSTKDRSEGLLLGLYFGDGCFSNHTGFNLSSHSEEVAFIHRLFDDLGLGFRTDKSEGNCVRVYPVGAQDYIKNLFSRYSVQDKDTFDIPSLLNTSRSFVAGLLDGLLSSDGNVNEKSRYPQVRFKNTSHKIHELIRHLFLIVGADYKIYKSGEAGEKSTIYGRDVVRTKDIYEGVIDGDSLLNFFEYVRFLSHDQKNQKLRNIVKTNSLNGNKWLTEIVKISPIGYDTVYDLYEPISDDFNTAGYISRGCGEIGGMAKLSTVCLLGSINVTMYVNDDRTFNWKQYNRDVEVFARMLDNVNDIANQPLEQYNWATQNVRQYGMGINGLGSALIMLGLGYDTDEGRVFAEKLTWIKEDITWRVSALLAKEKGVFPAYDKEKFENTYWFKHYTNISEETKDLLREYGARNAKTTTNPPLGNSSVMCDMVSNGLEPIFTMEYYRTYIVASWPEGLTLDNVRNVLKETKVADAVVWEGEYNGMTYYFEPHNRGLCIKEPVRDYGYAWLLERFPEEIQNNAPYLVTTDNLGIDDHVRMQAIFQRNCNQSISKTCNLPADYPYEDFKRLYLEAWKAGLNGFTTYRSGTMEEVLSRKEAAEEAVASLDEVVTDGVKLPKTFSNGETTVVKKEDNKFYLNFSYHPDDAEQKMPLALWINSNKRTPLRQVNAAVKEIIHLLEKAKISQHLIENLQEKIKEDADNNRLGRAISMALRHNIPLPFIVDALNKIDEVYVSDLVFAVKKFLTGQIKDGIKLTGVTCSACGSKHLIYESGCSKCLDCGSSNCS